MKLVAEWQTAWKWFSTQAMALVTVLLGVWATLPDDLKSAIPHWAVAAIAGAILIGGIAGRLIDQTPKPKP